MYITYSDGHVTEIASNKNQQWNRVKNTRFAFDTMFDGFLYK